MEIIRGDGNLLTNIDLAPGNVHQEVIQNIAIILGTIQKSVPMLRRMGTPGEIYGRPLAVAENMLVGEIYDQIEEYEPRAILGEVTFEQEKMTGKLIPIIELMGVQDEV